MGGPLAASDGVLYWQSRVAVGGITDGTSSTLLLGERPPLVRPYFAASFGNWVEANLRATAGYDWGGNDSYEYEAHVVQYTANTAGAPAGNAADGSPCPFPPAYRRGTPDAWCDFIQFWSLHPGGATSITRRTSRGMARCSGGNRIRLLPA